MSRKFVCIFILFALFSSFTFAKPKSKDKTERQTKNEVAEEQHNWIDALALVQDATKQINSQSFAIIGMGRYSSYEKMPDYYKALSDALDEFGTCLGSVYCIATLYADSTGAFKIEYGGKYGLPIVNDEQTAIRNALAELENESNSEKLASRIKLGLAQNLVLLSQSYIDLIKAVNNAENQFYDENLKAGVYSGSDGAKIVTKEEQLETLNLLGSYKNQQYNGVLKTLLSVSYKALDSLKSDLTLPMAREDLKKL